VVTHFLRADHDRDRGQALFPVAVFHHERDRMAVLRSLSIWRRF
jgi:hypothetical protein